MSLITIISKCRKCDIEGSIKDIKSILTLHRVDLDTLERKLKTLEATFDVFSATRYSERILNSKFEVIESRMSTLKDENKALKAKIEKLNSMNNINITVENSCLQKQIDELRKLIQKE